MSEMGLLLGEALPTGPDATLDAMAPKARLRALVDTHYDFVWRSLRRLGVAERDIDDGLQKVFLVVSNKLEAIRPGTERAFLFQTALRVAADSRRAHKRRREVTGTDQDHVEDPRPGPEELMDLRRARQCLDEVLDDMSLDLRAVFALFEFDQMTLSEIAEVLDLPRGTVASRLRRARQEFYEKAARFFAHGQGGGT